MIVFAEEVKIKSMGKISVKDSNPELVQIVLVTIVCRSGFMLIAYLIVISSRHNPPTNYCCFQVIISIEKHAVYVVIVRISHDKNNT